MKECSPQQPESDGMVEGPRPRHGCRDRLVVAGAIVGCVLVVVIVAWARTGGDQIPKGLAPATIAPLSDPVCPPASASTPGAGTHPGTTGTPSPLPSPATALDIAQRVPGVRGVDDEELRWRDPLTDPDPSPMLTEHLRSAATTGFVADRVGSPISFKVDVMVVLTVWVYDSPANRLDAEQANPPGEVVRRDENGHSLGSDLRCFADCGPIVIEVSLKDATNKARAAFTHALASSRAGLEAVFGGCPASEDLANPPTVGSWPVFVTRVVCMSLQRGEVPEDGPIGPGSCDLDGVDLAGADLAGADLSQSHLNETNLSGANLAGADLDHVTLTKANLSGANLTGANLEQASMDEAVLTGAKLARANLTAALLDRADLASADLSGANLEWAHLHGANLTGANLTGADVEPAYVDHVIWSNTTCPDGTTSKASSPQTCLGHGVTG